MISPVSPEQEDVFTVEVGQVQDKKYVFDAGKYRARCTNVEAAKTKNGDPMVIFSFVGLEGRAKNQAYKFWNACVPGKTEWKFNKNFEPFGVKADANGKLSFKRSEVIGKEVFVDLQPDSYTNSAGKTYENMKVQGIYTADTGTDTAGSPLPF